MDIRPYRRKRVGAAHQLARPEPGIDIPFAHARGIVTTDGDVEKDLPGECGEPTEARLTRSLLRRPVLQASDEPARTSSPLPPLPPHQLRAHFRRIGMEESLIDQMVIIPRRASGDKQEQHVEKVIRRLIRTGATIPERGRVVASFVGPTGVGKTAAITKLATIFAGRGRAVSLVTIDTGRVGAVEQLHACARALDAPLRLVLTRSDFIAALDASHDADVVLIDTPGVSPYDDAMLEDLRRLVGYREAVHCYLTLAAPGDQFESIEAARRFARIGAAALILTKLDETRRYGAMLNVAVACGLPLGYLSAGRDVDDDLRAATPETIRDYILPYEGPDVNGDPG